MQGRRPGIHPLEDEDRAYLSDVLADGQIVQRVANRARALLAMDRGEHCDEISHWLGLSRSGLWYLWRRYAASGVQAIWDSERSGRPPTFSPSGSSANRANGVHRAQSLRA